MSKGKKKDWLCTWPDLSSNPASSFWEVCDLKTSLILFSYLGLSCHSLYWLILRTEWQVYVSGSQYITFLELKFYFLSAFMRPVFFVFPRTVWKTKVREESSTLENWGEGVLRSTKKSRRNILLPRPKEQKRPLHSLWKWMIKGTYAEVAVTSCQPLARFCFSSCSELIPSFRLISARCFSFAANTWDRVWISSSTYKEGGWGKNTTRVTW